MIGLGALTLELLKERSRKEHLFTAKCCDCSVQIGTPANKLPHFYHLSTASNCSGEFSPNEFSALITSLPCLPTS